MHQAALRSWAEHRPGRNHPVDAVCVAPWVSLELDPSGWVYGCCANQTYPLGRIGVDRLRDLWGGPRAQVLRDALARWDMSVGCASCRWHLEHGRMNPDAEVYDRYPLSSVEPSGPLAMTFALSNRCNLGCVMCTPELSSTLRREVGLPQLRSPYDDEFFEDLAAFLPGLTYAKFLGGEPFLIPEHHRVWDLMEHLGGPPRMQVTTNATVWNSRVEHLLERFDVDVTVSIDGATKVTYEAIRRGSNFEAVAENVGRFARACRVKGTELRFCFCLMVSNAHELRPLLDWADGLGAPVSLNVVTDKGHALYDLEPQELRAIHAVWSQQDNRGEPLGVNDSVWRTQLAQMERVLADARMGVRAPSGRAEPVAPGFSGSLFDSVSDEPPAVPDWTAEASRLRAWSEGGAVGILRVDSTGLVTEVVNDHPRLGLDTSVLGRHIEELVSIIESADGRTGWATDAVDPEAARSVRTMVLSERLPVRGESGSVVRIVGLHGKEGHVLLVAEDRIYDERRPTTLVESPRRVPLSISDDPVDVVAQRGERGAASSTVQGVINQEQSASGLGPWRSPQPPEGFSIFPGDAVTRTVGERFFTIAQRFPDGVALRSPSVTWTYAELASEVTRIAGGVARITGHRTGRPVALLADHDGPLVASVLGIISASQVAVILDPEAPREQTEAVVAEASPVLMLSDATRREAAANLARAAGCEHLALEDLRGGFEGPQDLGWHAPAMLAFTSGTSGTPKGAVINHGVLLNTVRGATDALGIGPNDCMPMLFPTSLAVAAYPMFIPLLNGGTLATLDVRSVGLAPIADFLVEERITLAYMAPTVVRFLVDALEGRTFQDLRMIALGGELVDAEILSLTTKTFGCEHVAVGYGTTETGVVSLAVYDHESLPDSDVSCGYPAAGVEFGILDESGAPLPSGTSGEIAVVSEYLFDGYWGHPELNRQVLASDPAGDSGRRLYRTGDLGRIDDDGALTLLGRIDTKVKIRGRFVVLGDVEADLHDLEGVADSAVTSRTVDGIVELVGYVVPSDPSAADPSVWRADLLERRDAYRVPSRWVVLDELPRLPNGKTDRRALPSPELTETAGGETVAIDGEGTRDVRRVVRGLWEELLPVGAVGEDEDFFELGGDSLLAAQMLVMLEQRTGVTVPMGEIVHARTVREVAEVLQRLRVVSTSAASTVSCVQHGDESRLPRLWFVHDLQGSAYRVRHVAEALGADQPVWSFESPLLAGEPNPHLSLDSFAARYLTDLRRVQPEGPYRLAGYSFGGICAYEMARQLVSDGEEVAFLGVIDVGPGYRGPGWDNRRSPLRPWFGVAKPPPEDASVRAKLEHYRDMVRSSPAGAARHLMVRSGLARLVDPLRFRADLRRHGRVRPEWRLWYAWEEHWRLAAAEWNRSNTYAGRVDLFWANESASADSSMGWEPLVGELVIHRFEGDHLGVLEPRGAAALARSMRSAGLVGMYGDGVDTPIDT